MTLPVIVMTSDKYLHAVAPFAYLFNKYWGEHQHVTVVCFEPPSSELPPNFSVCSLGSMANYPVKKWSNSIRDFLIAHQQYEHFILMLEDYWLVRDVDVQAVNLLSNYVRYNHNVLKVDLCADRQFAAGAQNHGYYHRLDLVKSDHASQYHMSLMTGIWNRELFLRFVIEDETPWEVELNGTPRVAEAKDEVLVIGTKQWPVRHTLAFRGGDASKMLLNELQQEDVNEMTRLGLLQQKVGT